MTQRKNLKILLFSAVIFAAFALLLAHSPKGKAAGGGDDTESKIQIGLAIAPVPLNLVGKNRARVGLGSYLVNAAGDCNGCHHAPLSNSSPYAPGHDPFAGQPKQVEQAGYRRRRTAVWSFPPP